jgi:hypothetical protein
MTLHGNFSHKNLVGELLVIDWPEYVMKHCNEQEESVGEKSG